MQSKQMKKAKKILATFLATTVMATSFSNMGFTVWAFQLDEAFDETLRVDVEAVSENFPSSLDWSQSEYFPAIGNQGSTGSCGYYSIFYTNFTFVNNRTKGVKTTESNTVNPMFGYNFYGIMDKDSYYLTREVGFATLGVLPLDQSNRKTLSPTKEVWESALNHRAEDIETVSNYGEEDAVITGPTDPSLNQIKQSLNDGYLMGIGTLSSSWNFSVVASGEHEGEIAIDRCDAGSGGGHGVSLVGYDDTIWIDINYDGEVQTAELGAFKIANSWGTDWGNEGFAWVAYDALNVTSQILTDAEQTRINAAIDAGTIKANKVKNSSRKSFFMYSDFNRPKVREKDNSGCICYMTVNTGSRKDMTMTVTATSKADGTESSYQFLKMNLETENLAWDGTTSATDGTMVFDLDNVIKDISSSTMDNYTWKVTFEDDIADVYALTVKDLYFTVDGTKKYTTNISEIPLNGTEKVYTMVSDSEGGPIASEEKTTTIYYYNSAYSNAYIHYRTGTGTWTTAPGVLMCNSDEQNGYTWKYVIDLGDESQASICFNNGDGSWDNNNSQDYTVSEGIYGIKNGSVTELEKFVPTPTPTVEPTATVAPTVTVAPTITDTPRVSEIPGMTVIPSVTAIPTVTVTPMVTAEPTTVISTVTVAPTATAIPTVTVAPTATAIPTVTAAPTATEIPTITPEPTVTARPVITANPIITEEPEITVTSIPTVTTAPTKTPNPTATPVSDKTTVTSSLKGVKLVKTSTKDSYKVFTNKSLKLKIKTNGKNLKYQIVSKGKKLGKSWKSTKGAVTLKKSGVVYIKYTLNGKEVIKKTVGVIIDKKKPSIKVSGRKLKATDKGSGIKYIKVNGKKVKNNSKLKPGKKKIVVMDKAGNKVAKTVKIK